MPPNRKRNRRFRVSVLSAYFLPAGHNAAIFRNSVRDRVQGGVSALLCVRLRRCLWITGPSAIPIGSDRFRANNVPVSVWTIGVVCTCYSKVIIVSMSDSFVRVLSLSISSFRPAGGILHRLIFDDDDDD